MTNKISFLLLVFLGFNHHLFAQIIAVQPDLTDGTSFHTLQREMNDFFLENPGVRGYKQWKRKEWFLEPRLYPSGKMENLTLKTWKEFDRYVKTQPGGRATHGDWLFLGPTFHPGGLGRLNTIAFHPTDVSIMYVGSSNGGVWKSTTLGTTWTNITPHIPLISIADIKLSPSNSNVIYILTGDGDPAVGESDSHSQTEVTSIGILRSSDAGATWYPTDFSFSHPSVVRPTKLLIHPTNVNIQYVVSTQGIYRTTDHWENWEIEWGSLIYDIEFKPDNAQIMYASGDNEIIKSTDGGDNWNAVTDTDFSFGSATRIELAVAPNNANIVYALVGNWSNGFIEFLQSNSQGNDNTWTSQNSTTTSLGTFSDYCIGLVVDPSDWTDVFGGMQWINRSLDQGVNWSSVVQNTVHADIHDVAYANGALWVCCDGGLYKSLDEGNNWTDMSNGMAITEIYRIAGTPLNALLYFAGCQDNGTMRRNGATSVFDASFGADGMTPLIDYENSNIVYASWQNGNFEKSITGGGNGSFIHLNIPGGSGNWITPAVMDPADPDTLFVGKSSVIRTKNGGVSWDSIGNPAGARLNCLAQGTNNRNFLYASSGSAIFRTTNALINTGSATWTNVGAEVPDLFITGIIVDPTNALNAFVTLSGYNDGVKVYETEDGGVNWENISGTLPNVPVNCIQFDENGSGADALYIGTDIGVFYRDDNIGDWIFYSNFFTAVNISDLYINDVDNAIVAGTYGRGLWRSSKYGGCSMDTYIANPSGIPIGGVKYYSSINSTNSSANYRQDIGTEIHYKAGNHIDLTVGFSAAVTGFFEAKIGPCPGNVNEPFMSPFSSSSKLVMTEFEKKSEK